MQVAQRNLEVAYFNTGYYDRRVAELRERLRSAPGRPRRALGAGPRVRALGDVQGGGGRVQRDPASTRPNDVGAIVQLGLAEKASGDLERAQRWFERAPGARRRRARSCSFYIGEVLYNRGLNEEALDALRRSIELNPDNADAHYLLGFVLGDLGRARGRARSHQARHPAEPVALARAGEPLDRPLQRREVRGARPRAARAPQRRSCELSDRRSSSRTTISGLAFRQKGYYAEALREYRLALERDEDRELVLQAMAEVHLLKQGSVAARSSCTTRLLRGGRPTAQALERARRRAAPAGATRRGGRELPARARARSARTRSRTTISASRSITPATPRRAVDAFRAALSAQPAFVKAWLNLALLLYQREAAAARARGVPPGADGRGRAAGGVERRRARARRAQEVRGRAQRVRPRDPRAAGLRGGALQPGLHALEPRRLRGRAARHEARARARSVLRAAEVRARDRPRVRGSGSLDRAGARRRRADGRGRWRASRSMRSCWTRCSRHVAGALAVATRPRSRPARCAGAARDSVRAGARLSREGHARPRRRGGEPRARARGAKRRRASRCSATSSCARGSSAKRWSGSAARA